MSVLRRHLLLVTAVASATAALCLYWSILHLPLSFDDLLHIRLVKGLNYGNVWLPQADFPFFRPFLFLPFLFTRSLFTYYPAPVLYGFNLALHALNAVLLVALAWRLWQRWPRALAAGLLLACYPFSFQTVAVFGNNIYLSLLAVVLLALHSYLWAVQNGGWWWGITAVLFLCGLLSHELMVLFGVYAALTHWAQNNRLEIWHGGARSLFSRSPYLLFLIAGILYIAFYQFLPLAELSLPTAGNLPGPKAAVFAQALTYPLAWLGMRLHLQATPLIIGWGLGLTFLFTILVARRPENRLALLLGWGWWGSTAVLLAVTLTTSYILHSPRLHYLGSVGVCLLWAVLLDSLFRWRRLGRVLWAVALGTMLFIGIFFVRGRLNALADLGTPVAVLQAEMAARPLPEGVLLVNLPAWDAPAQNTFPVGVEHVALMGDHIFAEELVWENLRQMRPVRAVELPELRQEVSYPTGIHVQSPNLGDPALWAAAGASVFISRFTETGVHTERTGHFFPANETAASPLATWGDDLLLAGTAVACNTTVTTDLTWQLSTTAPTTTSLFVQVLDENGRLLGQADGPPLQLRRDWLTLPPDWLVTDHRLIQTDGASSPTTLLIGFYDYISGERTPGTDAAQQPLAEHALRLPIQPCP